MGLPVRAPRSLPIHTQVRRTVLKLEARQVAPTRKGAIGRIVDRPQKECTPAFRGELRNSSRFGARILWQVRRKGRCGRVVGYRLFKPTS